MGYFVFNDISSQEMGVIMEEAPSRTLPKIRTKVIENDYMNGSAVKFMGASTFDITLKVGFDIRKNREEEIYNWLLTGQRGKLSFSDYLEKYYDVYIADQTDFRLDGRFFRKGTLKFVAQPFKKYINQSVISFENCKTSSNAGIIEVINTGNYFCEPKITITGKGEVGLVVNNGDLFIINFDKDTTKTETLVINSEEKDCSLLSGTLANRRIKGSFPTFDKGKNTIRLEGSGTVSSMKIELNQRWLG